MADDDVDMYSDSGEDVADDKPLHVNSTEEEANPEGKPSGASTAKRRKTTPDPVNVNDVTMSVEDEPMSDVESENNDQVDENMDADDSALIKEEKAVDQGTKEKMKKPSSSERSKKQEVAQSSKDFTLHCLLKSEKTAVTNLLQNSI